MRGRGVRAGPASLLVAVLLGGCAPTAGAGSERPVGPPARPSLVIPVPTPREGFQPDPAGLLARITITDGYADAMLSLSADGRVVLVADTSVNATRDDFRTWTVSDAALDRALRSLRRLGILEAEPGTFGSGEVTPYSRSVGVFLAEGRVVSGSQESARFPALWRAAVRLVQPASYADGLLSGPEPFVPTEIGLLLSRPDPANPYPVARWPFDEPIAQVAHPVAGSPGDLAVCLVGADAAKLFASLPDGRVGVFRWTDGASVWSGGVHVSTPGYTLHGGGCDSA